MAKGKVLTVQRTIYLTKEMYTQLDQLALRRGQGCKANDLVREALRAFLNEQAEVMASRRHFQKTFQARIDQFEANIHWSFSLKDARRVFAQYYPESSLS